MRPFGGECSHGERDVVNAAAACDARTRRPRRRSRAMLRHASGRHAASRHQSAENHLGRMKRIIIGMTGASGAIYGVRLLEALRAEQDVETHLIVTRAAALNIAAELEVTRREVEALADVVHSERDIGASIASGSFRTDGMVIAPCSMRTLAGIATGVTDTLVSRAADVVLKERRRLILLVRESPLHLVHLRNMATATELGAIVFPPMPAFYAKPESIDVLIDQSVGRVLDLLGFDSPLVRRWAGLKASKDSSDEGWCRIARRPFAAKRETPYAASPRLSHCRPRSTLVGAALGPGGRGAARRDQI